MVSGHGSEWQAWRQEQNHPQEAERGNEKEGRAYKLQKPTLGDIPPPAGLHHLPTQHHSRGLSIQMSEPVLTQTTPCFSIH